MSSINSTITAEELSSKSVEELNLYLSQMAERFQKETGLKPSILSIQQDFLWNFAFTLCKNKEKEQAQPNPSGCQFYIARRRRYCTKLATCENGLCSEHDSYERKLPLEGNAMKGAFPMENEDLSNVNSYKSSARIIKKMNINRRMKKMTNPDAIQFSSPVSAPNWSTIFSCLDYPLFLDIGCAKGRFLKDLSQSNEFEIKYGKHNFVGVELFESLVIRANNKWANSSLFYLAANINKSYHTLNFPNLTRVSIQFPDPWFEKKKLHRRVVNKELADWVASALPIGGEVFLVSDVLELSKEMRKIFLDTQAFQLHHLHHTDSSLLKKEQHEETVVKEGSSSDEVGWLSRRPYQVPTERDVVCEIKWRPVYRSLLVKV